MATPSSQTICSGLNITTIALTGDVTGTTYTWTRDNTPSVTGIAANGTGNISGSLTNRTSSPRMVTFTITPSYTNGGVTCTGTPITATVLVNPLSTIAAPSVTDVSCPGGSDGKIDITVTGAPTLLYNWSKGAATEDIMGLTAGTYSVIVKDGNGCKAELQNILVGTVPDVTPPTFTKPADIIIFTTATCTYNADPFFSGFP